MKCFMKMKNETSLHYSTAKTQTYFNSVCRKRRNSDVRCWCEYTVCLIGSFVVTFHLLIVCFLTNYYRTWMNKHLSNWKCSTLRENNGPSKPAACKCKTWNCRTWKCRTWNARHVNIDGIKQIPYLLWRNGCSPLFRTYAILSLTLTLH